MHIAEKLRRRIRDEDGGIMIFIIMMFLTMIVIGGMAVDFMRHETARSDLQNALDRGILAVTASSQDAIDKTNQSELEALVGSYMSSRSFKSADMDLEVPVPAITGGSSTRRFEAHASYQMPTYFLKLIGIPTMLVRADSGAEEGFFDTEVAMVLDVSSSMVWQGPQRLPNLKIGASAFVDKLLTDERTDKTMISLVPFSGSTALPPEMAALYNIEAEDFYDYRTMAANNANGSICVMYDFGNRNSNGGSWEGELGHFSDPHIMPISYTGILDEEGNPELADTVDDFTLLHHFRMPPSSRYNPNNAAMCPKPNNAIMPFSNDPIALKDHIDGLAAEYNTATYIGIKWATALLQPTSSPVLEGLVNAGFHGIDPAMANGYWPRDRSDPEFASTKKVMVILSDGENTKTSIMDDETYREGNPNRNRDDDDIDDLYSYWDSQYRGNYSDIMHDSSGSGPDGDNDGIRDGNMSMREICDVAKSTGITIYSIAYEVVNNTARQQLEYCASEPKESHYFEGVNGSGLTTVFDKIAAGVAKLRLVN